MNMLNHWIKVLRAEVFVELAKPANRVVFAMYVVLCVGLFVFSPVPQDAAKQGDWYSLLPAVGAVVFAFVTRRLLMSLFLAVVFGGIFQAAYSVKIPDEGRLLNAVQFTPNTLISTVGDGFNQKVLVFIVLMLAMITVIIASGGLHAMIERLAKRANSARSSKVITAFMGLLIFIDDYANSMIVGSAMRPVTDRYKISREKLAFLVDATAAPIAGLAVISTWIGYEVGLFGKQAQGLGYMREVDGVQQAVTGYSVFLDAIPFRFYCMMMIIFVFINVFLGRDFGAMFKAEHRARTTGKLRESHSTEVERASTKPEYPGWFISSTWLFFPLAALFLSVSESTLVPSILTLKKAGDGADVLAHNETIGNWICLIRVACALLAGLLTLMLSKSWGGDLRKRANLKDPDSNPDPSLTPQMSTALIPLAGMFSTLFIGLWLDGGGGEKPASAIFSFSGWLEVIQASENNVGVLTYAGFAGLSLAVLCGLAGGLSLRKLGLAALTGARAGFLPMAILIMAWSLKTVCDAVYTGPYLANLLGDSLSLSWFPAAVFIISGLVAFSTGTSWGTMAILIPTITPIAFQLDGGSYGLATMICLAAILDGAIFGDHCSPISDTTILSSIATHCDHLDHVRTQMPYALLVAIGALLFGYLPASGGMHWSVCLLGATVFFGLTLKWLGKTPGSV